MKLGRQRTLWTDIPNVVFGGHRVPIEDEDTRRCNVIRKIENRNSTIVLVCTNDQHSYFLQWWERPRLLAQLRPARRDHVQWTLLSMLTRTAGLPGARLLRRVKVDPNLPFEWPSDRDFR